MRTPIRWQVTWPQGSAGYELISSQTAVLKRARQLLHPFLSDFSGAPRCQWSIEPDGNLWSPHLITGELPPVSAEFTYNENPRTLDKALTTVEFASIWNLIYAKPQPLTAHAALMAKDDSAVLILGPKYAGKSTLACALWRAGWELLTDDVALLDPQTAWCGATPRRVSLRHSSRELLGEDLWQKVLSSPSCSESAEGYLFAPADISQHSPVNSEMRLRAIIFLARRGVSFDNQPANAPLFKKMHQATTLTSLFPYTNSARVHGVGAALAALSPLADRVPAFDLARSAPWDMVKSVKEILHEVI